LIKKMGAMVDQKNGGNLIDTIETAGNKMDIFSYQFVTRGGGGSKGGANTCVLSSPVVAANDAAVSALVDDDASGVAPGVLL